MLLLDVFSPNTNLLVISVKPIELTIITSLARLISPNYPYPDDKQEILGEIAHVTGLHG